MKKTRLGHSDLEVSVIGLGTMTFGEQNTAEQAHQQLDYAMACGINLIDTAELYPVMAKAETYGHTEIIIGQWLQQHKEHRKNIVLASKIAGPARGWEWIRSGTPPSRQTVKVACEASLQRLQTDYLDLYQIHWPTRHVPLFGGLYFDPAQDRPVPESESMLAVLQELSDLVTAGKVRYIGISNETPWGVSEYLRLAEKHHLPRIVSIQNAYNLINRSYDNGLDEMCYRDGIGFLAYSPLAFGLLTGKYQNGGFDAQGQALGRLSLFPARWSPRYSRAEAVAATAQYVALAQRYGLSGTELAIGFCLNRPSVTSTLVGATTVEQLRQQLKALDVAWPDELKREIDQLRWQYRDPAQ